MEGKNIAKIVLSLFLLSGCGASKEDYNFNGKIKEQEIECNSVNYLGTVLTIKNKDKTIRYGDIFADKKLELVTIKEGDIECGIIGITSDAGIYIKENGENKKVGNKKEAQQYLKEARTPYVKLLNEIVETKKENKKKILKNLADN